VLGFNDLSGNGGSSVIGPDGVVYALLLNYRNGNAPMWVVAHISPPSAAVTAIPASVVNPYVLGMAFY
jgi:hypothetical protein